MNTVTLRLDNTYVCGRESQATATVPAPHAGEPLDDWFDTVVRPHTGDGHACGSREDALYEATITHAPGRPELVGEFHEWGL